MNIGQILSILIAIIIIFTITAFYWSRAKKEKEKVSPKLYIDAMKSLLAGEEKVAFQKFKEVARRDPDNLDAFLKLGDLFRKNKKYDKAIQIHKELLIRPSILPEDKNEILKSLAQDYSASGNNNKAIAVLQELYHENEKDRWVALRLLTEYETTAKWEEAFDLRKRITDRKEDETNRILALYKVFWGKARADMGELHKARVAYKEALNYDESCIPAYIYLGEAYYEDGRLKDAVEYWKKLVETIPEAGYLIFDKLEKSLFELGEYGDITEIYESVLSRNPKNVTALFYLARINEKKGNLETAVDQYRQILDTDPDYSVARLSLAVLHLASGHQEEAMDLLENLVQSFPPARKEFICQRCGHKSAESLWKCPSCQEWNSFKI
ncbi:MAG TPA: tetratricopeptide repeat protein [candidate division Zixibacteria bacterium]